MSTFQFAHPAALWLLLLVPLLGLLRGAAGRHGAVRFSFDYLPGFPARPARSALGAYALLGGMATLSFGIFAIARPQTVRVEEKIEDSGIDIMIALDVSLSMAIEDFRVENRKINRLTLSKNVIRDFVKGRRSDRIGLVAFAGRPYVASPLTMDQKWFDQSLERVGFNLVEDGTAIGSAIATAAKRLDKREAKSKIILLLTDGANNSGLISPKDAARLAKTLGIKIYAIAIGTPGKHMIPIANRQGFLPGIRQEFDDETMKAIAEIGEGQFFKGQDTEAVQKIFESIDQLEKTKLNVRRSTQTTELFSYPTGAALLCAMLGATLSRTVGRRFP